MPSITDPNVQGLLPQAPASSTPCQTDGASWLQNGNLNVSLNDGSIVYTRVSDGLELLRSGYISLESLPNQPSSLPQYTGNITLQFPAGDHIYGLGEHRTGQVSYTDFYHE